MIKKVTLGVIILVVSIIAYKLLVQITDAVRSGERLSTAAEAVYKLEARNKQLKKQLADVQSEDFIEEQARNKLSLGKKGETVVIIPEDTLKLVMVASASAQEVRLLNWLGWLRVFFH